MANESNPPFLHSLRFRYGLGLAVLLSIGGFFLWQEYKVFIVGNIFLILLLGGCLGMHFFMHGSHGHDHGKKDE